MFDAGFLEMLVIGVLALVIVGPERLPGIARKVGSWLGKARALVNTTKADIERELRTDEMRNMLIMQEEKIRDLQTSVENSVNTASQQLKDRVNDEISETETLLKAKSEQPPSQHSVDLDESEHSEKNTADMSKKYGKEAADK